MGQRTWGVVEVLAAHGTPKTDVVGLTAFALHAVFLIAVATRTRAVTPQCQVNRLQHRKEIPWPVKLMARSADAWCASALFPSGGTRPFVWGLGESLGPFSCTFSYLNRY